MSTLRRVLELARADVLERTRRYSFLLVLGGAAYLGYTVQAGYWTVSLGRYVPSAGPAWTGTLVAVVTTLTLSLFGFYVVRGAVERDLRTGVGPILATTSATRLQYATGKFLSHLAVLGSMLLVLLALAAAIQAGRSGLRGPGDAWRVVAPGLLLAAPMLVTVAGLALLFDSLRWLRGSMGSVVYFFLWVGALVGSGLGFGPWVDVTGMGLFHGAMEDALLAGRPDATPGAFTAQIGPSETGEVVRFAWQGIPWGPEHVAHRLLWVVVGGGLTALSAGALRLADPFREEAGASTGAGAGERGEATADAEADAPVVGGGDRARRTVSGTGAAVDELPPPEPADPGGAFFRSVRAELRLLLTGHRWWWYGGLAAISVAALLVPVGSVGPLLAGAWLLPLAAWSSLGCRDRLHGTEALLLTAPAPVRRQLAARWTAGVGLALLAAAGPVVRLVLEAELAWLAALGAGALFVPALALALGAWSGSRRPFELAYLLLWYLGPASGMPALDFTGATRRALEVGATPAFVVATVLLLLLAWPSRARRRRDAG